MDEVIAIYNTAEFMIIQMTEAQYKPMGAVGGVTCMSYEGEMASFYFFSSAEAANMSKEGLSSMAESLPEDWGFEVDGLLMYMGTKGAVAVYEKGDASKDLAWPATVPGLPKYPYGAIAAVDVEKRHDSEGASISISGTNQAEIAQYIQTLRQAGWWVESIPDGSMALKDIYKVTVGQPAGVYSYLEAIAYDEQELPSEYFPFRKPAGKKLISFGMWNYGGSYSDGTAGRIQAAEKSVTIFNFTCINMSKAEADSYINSLPKNPITWQGKSVNYEVSYEQYGPHIVFNFALE